MVKRQRHTKSAPPGPSAIRQFLGSAYAFASAIDDIVERKLAGDLAPRPLTLPQLKLLKLVALADARTLHDVAVFLGVSDAAASRAVDRMVRRHLLHRESGTRDRRTIHLSLTPAAERLLEAYERERARVLQEVFGDLDAGELTDTTALLDRLAVRLVERSVARGRICLQCGIHYRERCVLHRLGTQECFYLQHKNPGGHVALARNGGGPGPDATPAAPRARR